MPLPVPRSSVAREWRRTANRARNLLVGLGHSTISTLLVVDRRGVIGCDQKSVEVQQHGLRDEFIALCAAAGRSQA